MRGCGILFVAALAAAACHDRAPAELERLRHLGCKDCNLIIISQTNLRRDHVGLYGYSRNTTPQIDAFFANSMIMDNAFSPASWTLPVAASLYTSLFPYSHGVMNRHAGTVLPDEIVTLTEILRNAGYTTAAFTGDGDYNRRFNVAQGFDLYVDKEKYAEQGIAPQREGRGAAGLIYRGIDRLAPLAARWLEAHARERFFLLLQGFDSHCPHTPKKPFDTMFDRTYAGTVDFSTCLWTFGRVEPRIVDGKRSWPVKTPVARTRGPREVSLTDRDVEKMVALYDGEIAQADWHLGSVFRAIEKSRLDRNTIVLFLSEHGDLFSEHGRFMRGGPLRGTFYDQVLHVPVLLKHPGVQNRRNVGALAQIVDLMPTLLEMLALDDPQASRREGRSLNRALLDGTVINEHVYAASRYNPCNNAFVKSSSVSEVIRNERWKLIREEQYDATGKQRSIEHELYDISRDPAETIDRAADNEATVADLGQKLTQRFAAHRARLGSAELACE